MEERLDKLLSGTGSFSRSEAKKMIRSGRVSIGGKVERDPGRKADPERVAVDGQAIGYEPLIYLMMDKPKGVVSASRGSEPTVVDLVPEPWQRRGLFPAGRLDKDTTGFVLITNDGAFAHAMLSPKKHVPKIYRATLEHPVGEQEMEAFRRGVDLADGTHCMEATLTVESKDPPIARVELREGKYHQVKRMFAACGNRVLELRRIQMGGLILDESLSPGECRLLTPEERERILHK